ncbi:MAG: formate dehydrogenase [Pseudomonadales bacterium]|nr:formate dehydrogenase [Pseudomonadales bacterium]
MTEKKHTFCRVCEPSCALVAEVENDRLIKLVPDREHPVSRGFACHKGINFQAIHEDPDRLDTPLKRVNPKSEPAAFVEQSWDQTLADIASQLKSIQERFGTDAIAAYVGNPTAFNALGSQAMMSFFTQLGVRRLFNSGTQDCSNKFAGAEAVFGTSTLHPIPDLARTRYALIFGENPKVSHMSFVSMANPMGQLKQAKKNGATIKFINPRRIESATAATGEVLQIKPDTDLYLLAALLHEIDAQVGFDRDALAEHGKHVEGLRQFIAPYDADSVADITGIDAASIRQTALDFARAESACVHMSTGVNMGRQGTLCYWLLQMLSFVTGNLDVPGGNLYSLGFYPAAKAGAMRSLEPESIFFNSEHGELRTIRGALPGNLLPDLILKDSTPIKALIIIAGNPILSMGGEQRIREAFAQLDLIIVLDLVRNASGEYADYLLPCADMLERPDINICGLGMQAEPYVQYTDAVVQPKAQRKPEWWILGKLEQALGFHSLFDGSDNPDPFGRLNKMLGYAGLTLEELKAAPCHSVTLPEIPTGRFYRDWLQTEDKKVDCCPPLFAEAIEQAHKIFVELRAEPKDQLKLISLRTNYMQNSWYHNVSELKREHQLDNPLHISPQDALQRNLQEGQQVQVFNQWGRIAARIHIDDSLRQGTVAMTHGWGNQRTPGLRIASEYPGTNVNQLLPTGPGSFEKLSNQAHMTGIKVQVEAR